MTTALYIVAAVVAVLGTPGVWERVVVLASRLLDLGRRVEISYTPPSWWESGEIQVRVEPVRSAALPPRPFIQVAPTAREASDALARACAVGYRVDDLPPVTIHDIMEPRKYARKILRRLDDPDASPPAPAPRPRSW